MPNDTADHRCEVGHMLEHVTAIGEIEFVVRYRQPLTESNADSQVRAIPWRRHQAWWTWLPEVSHSSEGIIK
jgi:hypothetical protein